MLRLVQAVREAPEEAGIALVAVDFAASEENILPALLLSAGEKAARFAGGYVKRRFDKEGWDWVKRLPMDSWSADNVARFLVFLPFERQTWEFAASKGEDAAASYWKQAYPFAGVQEGEEAAYAAKMFLRHRRPPAAFIVLPNGKFTTGRSSNPIF